MMFTILMILVRPRFRVWSDRRQRTLVQHNSRKLLFYYRLFAYCNYSARLFDSESENSLGFACDFVRSLDVARSIIRVWQSNFFLFYSKASFVCISRSLSLWVYLSRKVDLICWYCSNNVFSLVLGGGGTKMFLLWEHIVLQDLGGDTKRPKASFSLLQPLAIKVQLFLL